MTPEPDQTSPEEDASHVSTIQITHRDFSFYDHDLSELKADDDSWPDISHGLKTELEFIDSPEWEGDWTLERRRWFALKALLDHYKKGDAKAVKIVPVLRHSVSGFTYIPLTVMRAPWWRFRRDDCFDGTMSFAASSKVRKMEKVHTHNLVGLIDPKHGVVWSCIPFSWPDWSIKQVFVKKSKRMPAPRNPDNPWQAYMWKTVRVPVWVARVGPEGPISGDNFTAEFSSEEEAVDWVNHLIGAKYWELTEQPEE